MPLDDLLGQSKQDLGSARTEYLASLRTAPELEGELRNTIQEVFKPDVMQLAQQRGEAAKSFQAAPQVAQETFSGIFDPKERARLENQMIGNRLSEFITAGTLANTLGGSLQDIIGRATGYEQARLGADQMAYEVARQGYSDALNEMLQMADLNLRAQSARSASPTYTANIGGQLVEGLTPSQYANILQTSQQTTQEQKAKLGDAQGFLNQIDQTIAALQGGVKTGPFSGRALAAQSKLGGASDLERMVYRNIGQLGAEQLVELGGKVLPAQEIQRFLPFTPDITMATELNIDNLLRMRQEANNALVQELGLPSGTIIPTDSYEQIVGSFRRTE